VYSRRCDVQQSLYRNLENINPDHPTGHATAKRQRGCCALCGLRFTTEDVIEVHHYDGNHNNNGFDNPRRKACSTDTVTTSFTVRGAYDKGPVLRPRTKALRLGPGLSARILKSHVRGNSHAWFGSGGEGSNPLTEHNLCRPILPR